MKISVEETPPTAVVTSSFTDPRHEYVGSLETAVVELETAEDTDPGYLSELVTDINEIVFDHEFGGIEGTLQALVDRFDISINDGWLGLVNEDSSYSVGPQESDDIRVSEAACEELSSVLREASKAEGLDISRVQYNTEDLLLEVW